MTVSELRKELEHFDDHDEVICEVYDFEAYEDLYDFYIDVIEGLETVNGIVREIRISLKEHQ